MAVPPFALDEVVQVGDLPVRYSDYQVGPAALARQSLREVGAEKLDERGHTALLRRPGDVGSRIDPEHVTGPRSSVHSL
jgi:hypothetical protein